MISAKSGLQRLNKLIDAAGESLYAEVQICYATKQAEVWFTPMDGNRTRVQFDSPQ